VLVAVHFQAKPPPADGALERTLSGMPYLVHPQTLSAANLPATRSTRPAFGRHVNVWPVGLGGRHLDEQVSEQIETIEKKFWQKPVVVVMAVVVVTVIVAVVVLSPNRPKPALVTGSPADCKIKEPRSLRTGRKTNLCSKKIKN
jgi:hypothetical protein